MTADPRGHRGPAKRLRAGLRRHGVIPRPAELRRLLRATDVRFSGGNALALYEDGGSGLGAMLEAIRRARKRVHLETYILRADETGARFVDALAERARAGVEVCVLYDAFGSRGLDPALFAELRSAGGDVVAFNPLRRFTPSWSPRRRDHRKILVVDGQVAFTGGLNIGDEYAQGTDFRGGERVPWRDAHVRVRGPAVQMLEAVFLESWFRADGPDRPWAELTGPAPAATGGETVGVLADGPTYHRRRTRDLLIEALARARREVRIVTPYFVPGPSLRDALLVASARGVRVELLIAGYSDHPILRWAAHAMLPALTAGGIAAYEYEHSMMHAKVAVFDGAWAVLGTSNLDRQSLRHSYEVNLIAAGGSFPERLVTMLERAIADARPVGAPELGRRSLLRRLRDRAAAFLLRHA